MITPKTSYTRTAVLVADNGARVRSASISKAEKASLSAFVTVMADLMDAIAKKEITHVVLGTPQNGSAHLLTINWVGGAKSYVGAIDIFDMGETAYAELVTDNAA